MSRLSVFYRNIDVSGSGTWTSNVARLIPYEQVTVDVTGSNHGCNVHFDQAKDETDVSASSTRYRMTREVHSGVHHHYTFPVLHEYGKLSFEETTGADTSGLSINCYGQKSNALASHQLNQTLYSGDSVLAGASTSVLDVEHFRNFELFGNTDASLILTPYVSADASNYYAHGSLVVPTAGDFHGSFSTTSRWLKVVNDNAATMTLFMTGQN
jgi:hypothetical protein